MKAAVVTDGGVEVREVAKPTPGPEQVLVRVRAAGLNRADLQVASGRSHGAIGGAGTIHMDLLLQPSQTLSLPFPTPLVFDSNAVHSCIGMSGGSVPGIVVVHVNGFVS